MAWTTLTFAFSSLLTSTKMTQLQDNFTAVAQRLSGAPVVTDAKGASWVFIEEQAASVTASLDFETGIGGTYKSYMFEFLGLIPVTDGAQLGMRMARSAGTYEAGTSDYLYAVVGLDSAGTAISASSDADSRIYLTGAGVGGNVSEGLGGFLKLYEPSNTVRRKQVNGQVSYWTSDATRKLVVAQFAGGLTDAVGAVMGVQFWFTSGSIESGSIRLWGLRNRD